MAVLLLATVSLYAGKGNEPYNFVDRPAVFKVKTDVVNADVPALFATIDHIDNSLLTHPSKYSFEPTTYRTRFIAQEDSANRIVDGRIWGIADRGRFASGYLDGAEVRVYRIINGKLELVRRDRVADGGTVVEYWNHGMLDPRVLRYGGPMRICPVGTTVLVSWYAVQVESNGLILWGC